MSKLKGIINEANEFRGLFFQKLRRNKNYFDLKVFDSIEKENNDRKGKAILKSEKKDNLNFNVDFCESLRSKKKIRRMNGISAIFNFSTKKGMNKSVFYLRE